MTAVPGGSVIIAPGGCGQDIGKLLTPLLVNTQSQGIGQIAFKQFGGFIRRISEIELILFSDREIKLKPIDLVHEFAAGEGRCLEKMVKEGIYQDNKKQHDRGHR